MSTVLVVGATGGIGRLVVQEAVREGFAVRALARNPRKAADVLPPGAEVVEGDLTRPETLEGAVSGVDAIIFTHGANGGEDPQAVDYDGVRNVLLALNGRRVRIVLMTAIGLTNRTAFGTLVDWKRRSERLLRASGLPYTIVRPGWFDYNEPGQDREIALQGDRRRTGTPADGGIARTQIAEVLVHALSSDDALGKTLELIAGDGEPVTDFDAFFAPLQADPPGTLDGVQDDPNMPLDEEPEGIREELAAMGSR